MRKANMKEMALEKYQSSNLKKYIYTTRVSLVSITLMVNIFHKRNCKLERKKYDVVRHVILAN